MKLITISSKHPVISFAGQEWGRLLNISGATEALRLKEAWIGTWEELKVWKPEIVEEAGGEWRDSGYSDDFVIIETENLIVLSGKSERAALYAVYQFAQETWGLHAVYPGSTPVVSDDSSTVKIGSSKPAERAR